MRGPADLAVPIDGHEPERRIDGLVDDGEVSTRSARRIGPSSGPRRRRGGSTPMRILALTNRIHVEDIAKVLHVRVEIVRGGGWTVSAGPSRREVSVRLAGRSSGTRWPWLRSSPSRLTIRRSALGRIVLEPPSVGWVVRGVYDDAVGEPVLAPAVVRQRIRCGDTGVGVYSVVLSEHDIHPLGRQHFERRWHTPARTARACSIPRNSGRLCPGACGITDGLTDGQNCHSLN